MSSEEEKKAMANALKRMAEQFTLPGQDLSETEKFFRSANQLYFSKMDATLERINKLPQMREATSWLSAKFPEFHHRLCDWWPEQLANAIVGKVGPDVFQRMIDEWEGLFREISQLHAILKSSPQKKEWKN